MKTRPSSGWKSKDKAGLTSLLCFALRHFFEQQGFQCLLSKHCLTLNSSYISGGQKALFNTPRPCFKFKKKFQSPEKKEGIIKTPIMKINISDIDPEIQKNIPHYFSWHCFQLFMWLWRSHSLSWPKLSRSPLPLKIQSTGIELTKCVLVSLHIAVTKIPSTSRVREELSCCLGGFILW